MNKAISRRHFVELLGVGVGAGALVGVAGCGSFSSTVTDVTNDLNEVGKVASYVNAIVAAIDAGAAFIGVTLPAGVTSLLTEAQTLADSLTSGQTLQAIQTTVTTVLTDIENGIQDTSQGVTGELANALNDAAELVPSIASLVGLVWSDISAATGTTTAAGMRRAAARKRGRVMGQTVQMTDVLADLKRIAALKK